MPKRPDHPQPLCTSTDSAKPKLPDDLREAMRRFDAEVPKLRKLKAELDEIRTEHFSDMTLRDAYIGRTLLVLAPHVPACLSAAGLVQQCEGVADTLLAAYGNPIAESRPRGTLRA